MLPGGLGRLTWWDSGYFGPETTDNPEIKGLRTPCSVAVKCDDFSKRCDFPFFLWLDDRSKGPKIRSIRSDQGYKTYICSKLFMPKRLLKASIFISFHNANRQV